MAQSSESESEIYLEDAEYDFDNSGVVFSVSTVHGNNTSVVS